MNIKKKTHFEWARYHKMLPVMAADAERKKGVSISHFSPSFCLQSLQIFLLVRSNQEQLYVLIALKIREKKLSKMS